MIRNPISRAIATVGIFSLVTAAQAGTVTTDGGDLVINTKGGLKVGTADKMYSVQLGGRIQYDYNHAEKNGVTDEDQFDTRRARIYVKGNVHDWSYKLQFNILNGGADDDDGGSPEDLYVTYNGFGKHAKISAGRQRMLFGLEDVTSSNDISMLERSAMSEAYAIARADGLRLHGEHGDFTYSIGAFDAGNKPGSDRESFGAVARITFAPVNTDESLVHVGAAYKDIEGGTSAYGLEAAAVFGPLHGQVEFFDADNGALATDTDGYYVQLGYVITGEQRPYKGGVFKRIKPSGKNGAVEVVARYEDGDGDFGDIELGSIDATAWGLGVNWYVNNAIRLGLNYTDGEAEVGSDDGEEFRARVQVAF